MATTVRRLPIYLVTIVTCVLAIVIAMTANGASIEEMKAHSRQLEIDDSLRGSIVYYNNYSDIENGVLISDLTRMTDIDDRQYKVTYATTGNKYCFGPEATFEGLDLTDTATAAKCYREDLFYRMKHDPALTAAIALACDNTFGTNILSREADIEMGRKADHAHKEFLSDGPYWVRSRQAIEKLFDEGEISFAAIGEYKSGMYMIPDGIHEGVPAVTVTPTWHEGGHMITLTIDGKVLKIRTTCGYQPIDVPEWTPEDDNPPPPPPPPTTTTVTEEPPPTTTTLKPKDPNDTPIDVVAGGGEIVDADKTPTTQIPIEELPDEYVASEPPVVTTEKPVTTKAPVVTEAPVVQTEVRTNSEGEQKVYEIETGKVEDIPAMEDLDTPPDPVFANDPVATGTFVAPE